MNPARLSGGDHILNATYPTANSGAQPLNLVGPPNVGSVGDNLLQSTVFDEQIAESSEITRSHYMAATHSNGSISAWVSIIRRIQARTHCRLVCRKFKTLTSVSVLIKFISILNSYVPLTILYLLSKNPASLKQLQNEVSPLIHCGQFDIRKSYTVLDSIIKESLRLMPPIPNGAQMQTPPLGLRIGETWIPGGVIVKVPFYSLFRGQAFPYV